MLKTIVGTIQSITARKQIDQALREREQQYCLLAANTIDAIWIAGLGGRFTYLSPSVEQLRGYTPEEVLDQSFFAVLTLEPSKIASTFLTRLQDYMAQGEPFTLEETYEVEQPCKDGSTVWRGACESKCQAE